MKLLLDTHIWIWSYPRTAQNKFRGESRIDQSKERSLSISAVSVWEAIVLLERKRIQFKGDFGE